MSMWTLYMVTWTGVPSMVYSHLMLIVPWIDSGCTMTLIRRKCFWRKHHCQDTGVSWGSSTLASLVWIVRQVLTLRFWSAAQISHTNSKKRYKNKNKKNPTMELSVHIVNSPTLVWIHLGRCTNRNIKPRLLHCSLNLPEQFLLLDTLCLLGFLLRFLWTWSSTRFLCLLGIWGDEHIHITSFRNKHSWISCLSS